MKKIFINSASEIRNGWWIVIFIGFIVLTQFIYKPITQNLKAIGLLPEIVEATSIGLVLLVTYTCLRLRKETLKNVGLSINGRWFKEFAAGILTGGLWLLAVALPLWIVGGVSFKLNPNGNINLIALGFYAFLLGALLEEVLHRGFIFQRLIDGIGFWNAQIVIALLFAIGHLGNPEMDNMTAVRAFIDLALASLIFGLAYWRTKSLALPTGLHLGWNWFQGNIMGFNVSGYEKSGWLQAVISEQPDWLTGGKFGLEGSLFSLLTSIVVLFLIWRWKGAKTPIQVDDQMPLKSSLTSV